MTRDRKKPQVVPPPVCRSAPARSSKAAAPRGVASPRGAASRPRLAELRAAYDAARTPPEMADHWARADNLAADAAASPEVRRALRSRARYETANNGFLDGMVQTLVADVVGRGPILQTHTGRPAADQAIEAAWTDWALSIRLPALLRLAKEAQIVSGECFVFLAAASVPRSSVSLWPMLLEADQVTTPGMPLDQEVDGMELDETGRPTFYHVLKRHPGEIGFFAPLGEYVRVPAAQMLHLFRARRPGQHRGIPQIASVLNLFAARRGMRQSVLQAARVAAELGAVLLESDLPPSSEPLYEAQPFSTLQLRGGLLTELPAGVRGKQLEPHQPSMTFESFDNKLLSEIGRPLSMPYNVAAANSSDYSYAGARLDHQTYDRGLMAEQQDLEDIVLTPLFRAWLREAVLIPDYLPARVRARVEAGFSHDWLWRPRPHVDPRYAAEAQSRRLSSGTATLAGELAAEGVDLETHVTDLRRVRDLLDNNDLRLAPLPPAQIDACARVLRDWKSGLISTEATRELLIAAGFSRGKAEVVLAAAPPAVVPAGAPDEDAGEEEEQEDVLTAWRGNGRRQKQEVLADD